jgi:hypothetical protein
LIMGLMHLDYRFNASLVVLYFPLLLLCHVLLVRLMWCPIGPCHPLILPSVVMSSCFCRLSFSRLFPFGCDHCLSPRRVCVSNFVWPFYLWRPVPSLVFFLFVLFLYFFFFFFYCAVDGRLSLYSFSRLPLIIPLSSVPDKSLNCTTPPSVTDFTSYGPNQCILSFPGC